MVWLFGECLRIKIRLDIYKPLMRGVTLDLGEDGEEEKKVWCPLSYEYLPNFCYTCGLIGHTDRSYEIKLKKGEEQQFSRSLRYIPEKKRVVEDAGSRSSEQHSQLPWRVNRGGRGATDLFGNRGSDSGKRSDDLSWRKSVSEEKMLKASSRSESEASSPHKTPNKLVLSSQSKKLDFDNDPEVARDREKKEAEEMGKKIEEVGGGSRSPKAVRMDVNSAMQGVVAENDVVNEKEDGKKVGSHRFKCQPRATRGGEKGGSDLFSEGRKITREDLVDMEIDEERKGKLGRIGGDDFDKLKAGTADRSYEGL